MLPSGMKSRPTVAIVGAGNLGTALALQLHASGYMVREIVSRSPLKTGKAARLARRVGASYIQSTPSGFSADLVWLSVPDRAIAGYAQSLADTNSWKGKIVFHSSGALSSDELAALRQAGASGASVHPLMTFVPGVVQQLKGISFAVEGDRDAVAAARRIIGDLGGEVFPLKKKDKVAYHAWGAFVSPLVIALLASAEEVARCAGISPTASRKRMLPILRQTIANYEAHGPAGAFSGPLIRGDAATIQQHLKLLRRLPEAKQIYVSLALSAMKTLPVKNRAELSRVLRKKSVSRKKIK